MALVVSLSCCIFGGQVQNLLDGRLDTPWLEKLDEIFPYVAMGASIAAELAIPPPGKPGFPGVLQSQSLCLLMNAIP